MANLEWTLQDLVHDLLVEFGISPDSTTEIDIIKAKINRAQVHIHSKLTNSGWLRNQLVLEVSAKADNVGNVTQGSNTITITGSGYVPVPRDIVVVSGANFSVGYTIISVTNGIITLQSKYRQATTTGATLKFYTSFIELPVDFRFSGHAMDSVIVNNYPYIFKTQAIIDKLKNSNWILSELDRIFTIRRDPLNITSNLYMEVLPYFTAASTIAGQYIADVPKLIDPTDIPTIPRSNRLVLFYFAAWFYATHKGMEKFALYRDSAVEQMQELASFTEYSVEHDTHITPTVNSWDTTGLVNTGPDNFDFVPRL